MDVPKIEYKNLTPEGRLHLNDYLVALNYLRHLNTEANKYSGDPEKNPASLEADRFMSTLPKKDMEDLFGTIVEESLEIKVGGVTVKYKKDN